MTGAAAAETTGVQWVVRNDFSLPPVDARLIGPAEKIPTPLDDRGLIDVDQLIIDALTLVDPTFPWPAGRDELSIHHFYNPANWYPYLQDMRLGANPAVFRNLPIHKGLMPRMFENWLHRVTIPPPVPNEEVRRHRIESWSVAQDLFMMAKKTARWKTLQDRRRERIAAHPEILKEDFDGEDVIGEAVMHERLERNFRGYDYQLQRHSRIPQEFHLLNPEGDPAKVATDLGRIVKPSRLYLVHRIAA